MKKEKEHWLIQEKVLAREHKDMLSFYNSFVHRNEDLFRDWKAYDSNRNESMKSMRKRLSGYKSHLRQILNMLQQVYSQTATETELQKKFEEFEIKLNTFKSKMSKEYEDICREERQLTSDVEEFLNYSTTWTDTKSNIRQKQPTVESDAKEDESRRRNVERMTEEIDRQSKIGAIDRQIATAGGRCGFWDSRDQDVFLRVWTQTVVPTSNRVVSNPSTTQSRSRTPSKKIISSTSDSPPEESNSSRNGNDSNIITINYENISTLTIEKDQHNVEITSPVTLVNLEIGNETVTKSETDNDRSMDLPPATHRLLIKRLTALFPALGSEDLEVHIKWYSWYEYTIAQKKLLLEGWKSTRRHRTEHDIDIESTAATTTSASTTSPRPKSAASAGRSRGSQVSREELAEWREKRELEKQQQDADRKRREDEEERERREETRRRQEQKRVQLQQWQQEKRSKEEEALQASQRAARRPVSADPSRRRKVSEDLDWARKRKELCDAGARAAADREERFQEAQRFLQAAGKAPVVSRDPSRLFAPTAASRGQKLSTEELDYREHQRATGGAHSAAVACGGYDLKFIGRAIPSWVTPAVR